MPILMAEIKVKAALKLKYYYKCLYTDYRKYPKEIFKWDKDKYFNQVSVNKNISLDKSMCQYYRNIPQ